jgi:hypothetical protein
MFYPLAGGFRCSLCSAVHALPLLVPTTSRFIVRAAGSVTAAFKSASSMTEQGPLISGSFVTCDQKIDRCDDGVVTACEMQACTCLQTEAMKSGLAFLARRRSQVSWQACLSCQRQPLLTRQADSHAIFETTCVRCMRISKMSQRCTCSRIRANASKYNTLRYINQWRQCI